MIASEQGMSSAAPTPWMARAPISVAMSGAQPQAIEASVKVMMPVKKSTRRPNRSAAAPPSNSRADMHSVYALITHCIAASVVPRSASIVGSATLTTDSSTNAMVDPNTAAASTQALSRSGQADLPRVDRMTCAAQGCVFEVITCCRSSGRVRESHRTPGFTSAAIVCSQGTGCLKIAGTMARPRDAGATLMMIRRARRWVLLACSAAFAQPPAAGGEPGHYDVLISGGTVYDGSGGAPFVGDVAITGDRLAYVGPHASAAARERIDAHGKAVAPGFVNMLAHPEESLLADGRALSDLRQGVTLEVLGEDSMGPLTPEMKRLATQRQAGLRYTIDWTTLGEYLHRLERRGIAPNVASFVGAGTVRTNVLGERDVQPTPAH